MSTTDLDFSTQDLIALDTHNRELALNLQSFIVEAPAGAGKTELLTQRYLKLLAVVDEPEEIVALTFSNKATAEMRNRILLSLESAQNDAQEVIAALPPHKLVTRSLAVAALQRANARSWDLLTQPARLRIMTIDALCSSLARQMPLLSRFGGQPTISDNAEAHYIEAARRCMSGILHETSPNDVVTTALRYMDNNAEKLGALLADMLAKRDQWLPHVGHTTGQYANDVANAAINAISDEITESIGAALTVLIEQDLQFAIEVLPHNIQTSLMPIARYAASNLAITGSNSPLTDWTIHLEADVIDLTSWQAVTKFLLTDKGTLRKSPNINDGFPATPEGKEYKEQFKKIAGDFPALEKLIGLLKLPDPAEIASNTATIFAISKLLQLATAHLWTVFQSANEVDFVEIAHCARLALGGADSSQGVTDLALKLDYRIAHLLIDEFQDTSPVQMNLIEQLTQGWEANFSNDTNGDGRTLFCVGDPMQSIYRFRKADVSLFLQANTHGIGHLPLSPLRLTRNNRSHPAVINWINQAFETVFPSEDNTASGAISYREFTATRPSLADEGVTVHPIIFNADLESTSAKTVEARYVADLIAEEKSKDKDKDKNIAVLVRSRSHLRELVSEIRRNHPSLKFQAVEIEELSNRQTVQDALSLTYALLHRADRVHWLSLLRAPWCGLTLHDLHALCADDQKSTLWQLIQDEKRRHTLSDDGQKRLSHVHEVLAEAFNNQGRMPLRRWLESTWLKLGGGSCLVDVGDIRDIQAYFDLVDKLSQVGQLDFTQLETAMEKLYAKPDAEADESLQFLTIHKSKGLEFDTVILPALNRPTRGNDPALLLWEEVLVDGQTQLIAAPFTTKKKDESASVYHYLQDLESIRTINESARLLYVAATRTIRKLHLVATVKPSKDGEVKPVKKSFLELLWPNVGGEFLRAAESSQISTLENKVESAQNKELGLDLDLELNLADFIPQLIRLPYPQIPDLLRNNQQEIPRNIQTNNTFKLESTMGDASSVATSLAMDCGTLAHLYMELIAKSGVDTWHAERFNQLQPAMAQWLVQHGHAIDAAQAATTHIINALQTTINSEEGRWVLSHTHSEATSELSLMQIDDIALSIDGSINQSKSHRIDRTFTHAGKRWIIDYKLTQMSEAQVNEAPVSKDSDLAKMAESHRSQLTRYAALFTYEALPIQTAVFFLSLGKLVML